MAPVGPARNQPEPAASCGLDSQPRAMLAVGGWSRDPMRMVQLRTVASADLAVAELQAVRRLLDEAFEGRLTQGDVW
jgi:hypothetical protein